MGFLGLGATEKPCPVAARAPDTEDRASSSAAMQRIGPIIGTVDIAESEDSYLFQVSLPGVRRDQSFSCELDMDGEVVISGMIATGEKMILRLGEVFVRKTENPYQPRPFSLSFQLPGPINPVQSNLTFRRDAIFEGVVKKQMND
ncbi:alpha-crystallin domain-containing protein 22.3-like [Syzygium oleosum]|uniref:alpha-crystallin domain-containing protein 22.3-like n=1 Tax=Syzygium oleosum TaxID=219896 RepID=UPI0011D1E427|nr:alpha-crystallin domain-containing protein 22.3-like [Syzygium oleosum]